MVLQRNADGEVTELETLEIQGGNENLPDVVEAQIAKGRKRMVLDLINEKHLNSNDLAQLIGAMRYARDAEGELVFANPNPRVSEILRITHLDDVMAIYDSIGAAADHFKSSD
jgi:anti-sigma B factor antagonist